jgi:cytochrome c-type biogenesis protein CcmH/NrfF
MSAAPLIFYSTVGSTQNGPAAPTHEDHEHEEFKEEHRGVEVLSARKRALMAKLRVKCPSSGNPTMANSSPTCPDYQRDMRLLDRLLKEKKTDKEIVDHFVSIRGSWVVADPDNGDYNWLSWALPIGALVIAVPMLLATIMRWTRRSRGGELALAGAGMGAVLDDDPDDEYRDLLARELDKL